MTEQRIFDQPWGVAVTGSRTWSDYDLILGVFLHVQEQHPGWQIRLHHGRCDPQLRTGKTIPWGRAVHLPHDMQVEMCGGDWLADVAARALQWEIRDHPADWEAPCRPACKPGHRQQRWDRDVTYCPAAGNYRNTAMLTGGEVDELHAFVDRCRDNRVRCYGKPPHGSHGTMHALGEARSKTTVQVFPWTSPDLEGIHL